jgi:hypothetical protein
VAPKSPNAPKNRELGAGKWVSIAYVVGAKHVPGGGQRSRPSSRNTTKIRLDAIHGLSMTVYPPHMDAAAGGAGGEALMALTYFFIGLI